MPKSKNGIFVLGCIIIGVTGLLLIYGILVVTGVIHLKENKLIFAAESASKLYDGVPLVADEWELTSGELMSGHYVVAKVSGEITEPGTALSTVSVVIYDSQDVDVTEEYNVQCVSGTLQVFGRRLVIMSGSSSKVYDGTGLTDSQCELIEGALMSGHRISLEAIGSIDKIGKVENTIKFSITDQNGEDVSRLYDIVKQVGTLEIQKIPYTVKTESDTKLYDGTALTCGEYTEYGNLMDGHTATVKVTGKIVGEGSEPNTATVKITDKNGKDVTHLYEVTVSAGTLKVVGPPRNDDSGGSSGGSGSGGRGSVSGSISGSDLNNPENESGDKEKVEAFRVTATSGGRILFRTDTFGDYNYHGWLTAPAEPDAAALYYTSRELKMNGVAMQSALVESIIDYGYLLPYYADEYTVNMKLRNYTVGYMAHNVLKNPVTDVTETEAERAYRAFVYMNYLSLPTDTKQAMLEILENEGLDASTMSVIDTVAWVENYVKHAATYNLKFAPYPDIVDTAIYFLTEAKEGVCRHYATAATVALRALGIPARYTVGFAADVQANVTTVVTGDKAHAWVEVYIDGLGWIAIDPTGSAGGSGGSGGEGDDMEGGGDIELDGDIPKKGNGGGSSGGGGSIKPFMTFVPETDGTFYFRQKHFGNYTTAGSWSAAVTSEYEYGYTVGTEALKGSGNGYNVTVTPVSTMLYLVPYYTDASTIRYFDGITPYALTYYTFDIMTANGMLEHSKETEEIEKIYRSFVYQNYLSLPKSTREGMEKLIEEIVAETGVELSSMSQVEIIRWVIDYVSSVAVFNKDFAEYPAEADVAIYFLSDAKEGIDAHFATSAAVMLRALGIPARYTMGYAATGTANESAGINAMMSGSWVEVYVDGFGWVVVDPAKDSRILSSGESGEGEDENEKKIDIVLLPEDGTKEYDGTPLKAENLGHRIKDNVQLYGKDRLEVTYGGEITEPGKATGYIISCRALDENDNDVSYRYNFDISATSTLTVERCRITVYSEDAIKVYDEKPLICPELISGYENKLAEGHYLRAEFSGEQTEIGMSENLFSFIIVDGNGEEIPDWRELYDIVSVYGSLRVVYSFLVFETDGITKEYDGTPLKATGRCEYVSGALSEGHKILSAELTAQRTTPGTTLNVPTVVVVDADGNDVSYMYALSEGSLGTLTVTRIKLKITSGSAEGVYDPANPNRTLTCEEFTCEGALMPEHKVEAQISGSISSVGVCDNRIDFVTVLDQNGNIVSQYYDIETVDGTLVILPPN